MKHSINCAIGVLLSSVPAVAEELVVYGSPIYDPATQTGYAFPILGNWETAGNGVGVGSARLFDHGVDLGLRAIRWDASGQMSELPALGPVNPASETESRAFAVNNAGVVVGSSTTSVGGTIRSRPAVSWGIAGTPTELGGAGRAQNGFTVAQAVAINDSGTIAGYGPHFATPATRAIRWAAGSTTAELLDSIGSPPGIDSRTTVSAINSSGIIVGMATRYDGTFNAGDRAVLWNPTGTAATQLAHLGTNAEGFTTSGAVAINSDGMIAGTAQQYVEEITKGNRAVRWTDGGQTVTPLETLGTDSNGFTNAGAWDMSDDGTVVGAANKYVGNTNVGARPVRWDAGGTAITELGLLGLSRFGTTDSVVNAINASNIAVGHSERFEDGISLGTRAVAWSENGLPIDLNNLIDPTSGWTLLDANSISDTDWVTGIGLFDPDGSGNSAAYRRAFLLQIPEPTSMASLAFVIISSLPRRRRGHSS